MKHIVSTNSMLENCIIELRSLFDSSSCVNLSYEKSSKEKTLKQLGFIFGALIDSMLDYDLKRGEQVCKDDIYEECIHWFAPEVEYTGFDGKLRSRKLRLSQMNVEQASFFIEQIIYACDYSTRYQGLNLTPDIRYCWVGDVTDDEILVIHGNSMQWDGIYPDYLAHIRKQPCLSCGAISHEAHHLRIGEYSGMSSKAPDYLTVPICHRCHIGELHQGGEQTFYKKLERNVRGKNMIDFALILFNRWLYKNS